MSDENNTPKQIDDTAITQKADEIAQQKIESLKQDLVQSISGKQSRYGDTGPESWDYLHDTIKTEAKEEAVREAEERIMKKLEAKEQEAIKAKELSVKQEEETKQQEWSRMTQEWQEAVEDGLLPDIDSTVKAKLREGKTVNDLTPEERSDVGLKAYNDLIATYQKLKAEGKATSLYRTAQKFLNQRPAGAGAPVFGSTPPATPPSDDYSYEEIAKARREKFNI